MDGFGNEESLRTAQEELRKKTLILEELDTFVVEYNFKTKELYIDPVKEKYIALPWDKDAIKTGRIDKLIYRPDIPAAKKLFDFSSATPEKSKYSSVLRLYVKMHKYMWFRVTRMCFFDETAQLDKIVILFTNTDEKAEIEQNMKFYAEKDVVTRLPNLSAFLQKAYRLIHANADYDYEIVRMDIERFRVITEMFGTKEGDALLRYIAAKIQERLEEEDVVAYCRVASDVFAMCIPRRLYHVEEVLNSLQRSVTTYPDNFRVVLAFGRYVVTEHDRVQMISMNTLLDRASAAQRTIKGNYLMHVATYDEGIKDREEAETFILAEMKPALEQEQFQVYLQPKVDMFTGKIVGSEALVRWYHPERGMIPPGYFVPLFERNGFVIEFDRYMVKHVCKIIRNWIDNNQPVHPISVNISRINLYNPNLVQDILAYVEQYQVPREYISFELTESGFSADNSYMRMLAIKLQREKFKVLMDDFGSGYSSLNTLKDIPVDILKVDLKFLPAGEDDKKASMIVRHVVDMAYDLGLDIVVEGVETEHQVEFLKSIDCRVAQGFYYYRPMPLEEYNKIVNKTFTDCNMEMD